MINRLPLACKSASSCRNAVRAATLFIGAVDDVVVSPAQIQAMRAHVPDLEIRMIDDCGHWTQQEHPDRTNALMLEWMSRRYKA
jgi:pimeloyl-ACP methyl ester carboxylesterase